ncbi:hypothetical protein DH2020_011820 [Rehmannia glutinosa]|uniref:B box-type domain-containing protein n=1 Tax=Rehmannia glutinosa TaxID=99300 RepID=A0ABR0XEH5_REHGL
MLKVENTTARDGAAAAATNSTWSRPCDTCHAATSTVYCRADSAYLCSACDADIHSSNPLARRHHRVPVPNPLNLYGQLAEKPDGSIIGRSGEDEDEAASWLLPNPTIKNGDDDQIRSDEFGPLIGGEVDEYLDLDHVSLMRDTLIITSCNITVFLRRDWSTRSPKLSIQCLEVYASRKAYAETRPRIKGRFAKRKDVEIEADHMFSTSFMAENASYGLVPSF